jgi:hypothetical protein
MIGGGVPGKHVSEECHELLIGEDGGPHRALDVDLLADQ